MTTTEEAVETACEEGDVASDATEGDDGGEVVRGTGRGVVATTGEVVMEEDEVTDGVASGATGGDAGGEPGVTVAMRHCENSGGCGGGSSLRSGDGCESE